VDVVRALSDFVMLVVWMGAWAQLLGMPVAWLRLRRTDAWKNRPAGLRPIDLLARFILRVTVVTVVWGCIVAIVGLLGGAGFSGGALLLILFGAPALFVPWWVLQQDLSDFPSMVEELREARERKLAERTRKG
jgi:hypothetical protein